MMPRPIADWLALWRDLPHAPRQVLLNRAHFPGSTLAIGAAALMDSFAIHPYTAQVFYAVLVIAGPSSLVAAVGACAHMLWERGLIWRDVDCECCGEDPDDGDDDEPEPDEPDDDGGFAAEVEAWLRTHQLTHTH